MRRRGLLPLIAIVAAAFGWLAYTLVEGNSPQLGLDLQGGASVVLTPTEDVDEGRLDQAREIISNRVDGLGVAEPDIHLEGDNIVVQLPGVRNASRALELVGQTAELRFRPVLCSYPAAGDAIAELSCPQYLGAATTTTTAPGETTTTSAPAETTTTAPAGTTTSEQGLGLSDGEFAAGLPVTEAPPSTDTTTTAPADTTTTTAAGDTTTTTTAETTTTSIPTEAGDCGRYETPPEEDVDDQQVVLPQKDDEGVNTVCYVLGPTKLTGDGISGAQARIPQGSWLVEVEFTDAGLTTWNEVASTCFSQQPDCPTNQIAIVLDAVVQSAPTFETSFFDGNTITITRGDGFPEGEAKDLALVLRYGALPVELEPQTVQTVSATLGKDSLRAGLAAGIGGLVLVALYILLYYRALGVVVILGMAVWGALNFSIITWLSDRSGLALTLAGVTGIIVSVGVTVDSYVVYFERLKDEIRSGKTLRSSVDRGFKRAFRTIITADVTAFLGAFLLFWLTVGSVRGFAFFLGLATLLDVVVAYMFTRPLVALLARSRFFTEARWVGVARGLARPDTAAAPAGGGR